MAENGDRAGANYARRHTLGIASVIGPSILVGCLGDNDDDETDDTDAVGDVEDTFVMDDADDDDAATEDVEPIQPLDENADDGDDDGDDADDEGNDDGEAIPRHDVAPIHWRGPPLPANAQYNYWGGTEPLPAWVTASCERYFEMGWSFHDQSLRGELVADYAYQPGILEVRFVDDVYWWSGTRYGAADWATEFELRNWATGGENFDAHPAIVTVEVIDDATVRISLADTWREQWAIHQALATYPLQEPFSSRDFNQPWLEHFEDTGGDLDAIEDIRETFGAYNVTDDEELVHQFHIPFEFRLDGSIGEVDQQRWTLELVPEKNGHERRYVDEINYTMLQFGADEEGVREEEAFLAEESPVTEDWGLVGDEDDPDIPFAYDRLEFQLEYDRWGWIFDCDTRPTDSAHFRRAWVYLADRTLWETPEYRPQEQVNVFLTDDRLERWVSDDVIAGFVDYGKHDVQWDEAEAELIDGGFEQDGDGNWLDDETGTPIAFTVSGFSWYDFVSDLGSDFWADLETFGLDVEFRTDGEWDRPVFAGYVGGIIPEFAFETTFGESSLDWAAPNPGLRETVTAPAMDDPDADPEDWIEYDTRAMTERLGIAEGDRAYQELVDQLAWVANHIVPKATMVGQTRINLVNANQWDVKEPAERPESWIRLPFRHIWHNGVLNYVPEDDR